MAVGVGVGVVASLGFSSLAVELSVLGDGSTGVASLIASPGAAAASVEAVTSGSELGRDSSSSVSAPARPIQSAGL